MAITNLVIFIIISILIVFSFAYSPSFSASPIAPATQHKRACPIIFHPVRQALVNLNQRIREKQSTPYGLNRLPETHALTHEIYQTSPNQQERQKNDLLYVCRKSNAANIWIYQIRTTLRHFL